LTAIFIRTGLYTMKSGKGLVEVRFSPAPIPSTSTPKPPWALWTTAPPPSSNQTPTASSASPQNSPKAFFGTVGQGLAKVELSSYSGTIRILKARLVSRAKITWSHSSFAAGPQSRVPILCLAGFMGSGKTTVGMLLARQLAWRFVDLDSTHRGNPRA